MRDTHEREGFSGGSVVKNPPAIQETSVQSLGWEDPLEKEMGTHPVFLPGESHGQRSLVGYSPWGGKEPDMPEAPNNKTTTQKGTPAHQKHMHCSHI